MFNKGIAVSGKELSNEILTNLAKEVEFEKQLNGDRAPSLVVVTIGEDPASKVYVNNKKKACETVGIKFRNIKFSDTEEFNYIMSALYSLSTDDSVDGIIVQLPIVSKVLTEKEKLDICKEVPDNKDVDGFSTKSKLAVYDGCKDTNAFYPCTPSGCIELLNKIETIIKEENSAFTYEGFNALVIGRSNIVGKPVANMLMAKNMTVTIAHSKTPVAVLRRLVASAEIIVSAVGKQLPVATMHSDALAIIDVGMNRDIDGKLCGDFSEEWKQENAKFYTPVPGGVGPMTVCMLMRNVVKAWKSTYFERLLPF